MKTALLILGLLLIIFIGYGLYKASGLKTIQIISKVTIKGQMPEVFDMVRYLNNFPKWSPFLKQDPAQKYEVKGKDGEPGAQYHWNGNGGKDIGYQEIVNVDTFSLVRMKCHIEKPFTAHPDFVYTFKETPEGIVVTQDFKVESDLGSAFFMWLFGAKKEMQKTNESGLELLKKAIEK
ncbi:MAG: SRPBCC family protein [Bacteroidia bacterium]